MIRRKDRTDLTAAKKRIVWSFPKSFSISEKQICFAALGFYSWASRNSSKKSLALAKTIAIECGSAKRQVMPMFK